MSTPSINTQELGTHASLATNLSDRTTTGYFKVPSWATFEAAGKTTISGAATLSGALTLSGGVNITSALTLGANGVPFAALRKSTASVALGTVGLDSVTTSVTINEVSAGDIILRIVPASIWSAAYYDIGLEGVASAASTVVVAARNSAATAINTAAMNMDFYWLDLA